MRILLALFVSLSINSYEFKSYEAKFQFQARGFSFPLNRYFTVKDDEINTRVKMNVFFYTYSMQSMFSALQETSAAAPQPQKRGFSGWQPEISHKLILLRGVYIYRDRF